MNYGSAGGLHDTATYLTLKMDIVFPASLTHYQMPGIL